LRHLKDKHEIFVMYATSIADLHYCRTSVVW